MSQQFHNIPKLACQLMHGHFLISNYYYFFFLYANIEIFQY